MAITTYSELQTAVLNWLGRSSDTEIASRVPEFIALFEPKARRALTARSGEIRSQNAVISGEYTTLPSDFVKLRHVRRVGNTAGPIQIVPDTVINQLDDDTSGIPIRCSVVGTSLRLNPAPSGTMTVEIVYTSLPALTGSATTNWLLDLSPDTYLYGALAEAAVWAGDERGEAWAARAMALLADINQASNTARGASDLAPTFIGNTV